MGTPIDRFLSGQDSAQLARSVEKGSAGNVDSAARISKLQMRTGLPEDLIERNLDAIELEAKKSDFNPDAFRRQSPIVANWLAEDPKNVTLIGEDLTKLSTLERHIGMIKDSFKEGYNTTKLMKIGEDAILGRVTPEQRLEQAEIEKLMGHAQADYGITGFFEGIPGAIANQIPIMGATLFGKAKASAAGAAAGGAAGAAVGAGTALLAGQLGPQIGTPEEVVTVPVAALAGARKGAIKGGRIGWRYGTAIQTARMEGALAYLDFEKLRDENGMPLDRDVMLGAAAITGAVNGALEMMSFETMAKQIPGLRSLGRPAIRKALMTQTTRQAFARFAKGVAVSMVTEGATEWMQSMTSSAAGELATMQSDGTIEKMSTGAIIDRIFSEEHMAQATQEARAGMQAGGGIPVATGPLTLALDVPRARRAQQNASFFESLAATTKDSQLIEKLPEKMQEAIERITKDGPVENVYAPIDSWNEHFQKLEIDPGSAAEEIFGDREAYDEAMRTGQDLVIPTSRYAVTIAPSEHAGFFQKVLRLGPNEMNQNEAEEYFNGLDQAEAKEAEVADEKTEQSKEALQNRIEQSLLKAGRPADEAKTAAVVKTRMVASMAARMGVDPMALYDRYSPTISGPEDDEVAADKDATSLEQKWFKRDKTRDQEMTDLTDVSKLEEETAGLAPDDPKVRQNKQLLDAMEIWKSHLAGETPTRAKPKGMESVVPFTDETAAEQPAKDIDPLSFAAMQMLDPDALNQRFLDLKKRVAEGERAEATPVDAAEMDRLAMFERNVLKSAVPIMTPEDVQNRLSVQMVMEYRNEEDIIQLAQKVYATQQYQDNLLENGEQWVTGIRNFNDMFARAMMRGAILDLRNEFTRKGFGTVEEFWKKVQAPLKSAMKEKGKEFMQAAREQTQLDKMKAEIEALAQGRMKDYEDDSESDTPFAKRAFNDAKALQELANNLVGKFDAPGTREEILRMNAGLQGDLRNAAPTLWAWATSDTPVPLPPGLYSKAEKIIEQKMDKIATRDQLKGLFKDVKTEEWKWLQLADFLESKESFTKQEVTQYLQLHRLRIVEVQPEGGGLDEHAIEEDVHERLMEQAIEWSKEAQVEIFHAVGNRAWTFRIIAGNSVRFTSDAADSEAEIKQMMKDEDVDEGSVPTLEQERVDPDGYMHQLVVYQHHLAELMLSHMVLDSELLAETRETVVEDWQDQHGHGGDELQYKQYTMKGGENYREILFTAPAVDYEDPHWNMQGTIAHVRLKNRVTADGKTTLHIEEIQSDLHESARDFIDPHDKSRGRRGYKAPNAPNLTQLRTLRQEASNVLVDFKTEMHKKYPIGTQGFSSAWSLQATEEEKAEYNRLIAVVAERDDAVVEEEQKWALPDAPFRTTWHEFVIKRVLRMAAEEGVDLVTWSTGEQIANVMGILQVADELQYYPSEIRRDVEPDEEIETQGQLEVYKSNRLLKTIAINDSAELATYIGQELADKLLASKLNKEPGPDAVRQVDAGSYYRLEGNDLKVGGAGMRGFYDKIVPDFIRKFTRQFGAEVKTVKVDVGMASMGELESGETEDVLLPEPRRLSDISFQDRAFVEKVHSVEMTPRLKKAALEEGFTLFQPRKPGAKEVTPLLPGFFSKAERTIETKMDRIATQEQLTALFKEVKTEEWKWLDLATFLESKERFTKDEVMQYLQAHRLKIVVDNPARDSVFDRHALNEDVDERVVELAEDWSLNGRVRVERIANDEWAWTVFVDGKRRYESIGRMTKEGAKELMNKQIGEDWKENPDFLYDIIAKSIRSDPELMENIEDEALQSAQEDRDDEHDDEHDDYSKYTLGEGMSGENYQDVLFQIPELDYYDPHYEGEGTIAHARVIDRTTTDGQKALHIEEIQSDLHEEGRESGYRGDPLPQGVTLEKTDKGWFVRWDPAKAPSEVQGIKKEGKVKLEVAQNARQATAQRAAQEYFDERRDAPDAPFKKTWFEFVLKAMIRRAAEGSYDSILITTGDQQNERYDIVQYAQRIRYNISTQEMIAFGKTRVVARQTIPPEDLHKWIGKELAENLLSKEPSDSWGDTTGIVRELKHIRKDAKQSIKYAAANLEEDLRDERAYVRDTGESWAAAKAAMIANHNERQIFLKNKLDKVERLLKAVEKKKVDVVKQIMSEDAKPKNKDDETLMEMHPDLHGDLKNLLEGEAKFKEVSGKEMQVGGQGMRGFYDKMVLDFLRGFGKRFGATVDQAEIMPGKIGETATVHRFTITPELKRAAMGEGFTLFQDAKEGEKKVPGVLGEEGFRVGLTEEELSLALKNIKERMEKHRKSSKEFEQSGGSSQPFDREEGERPSRTAVVLELDELAAALEVYIDEIDPDAPLVMLAEKDDIQDIKKIIKSIQYGASPGELRRDLRLSPRLQDIMFHPRINAAPKLYEWLGGRGEQELNQAEPPRGRIRINRQGIDIKLFKDADASTFIHESAHMYFEMLEDVVSGIDAPAELVKDYNIIKKWLGVPEGELLTVEQHETFARGFEAYLMEGRAPIPALLNIFIKFRLWLTDLYDDMTSLNVELTDEVRSVFDQLLATQKELKQAETEVTMAPMFADPSLAGMTETQAQAYSDAILEQRQEASEILVRKTMEKIQKEKSEVWQAEREKVRAMVAAEINDDPTMQARALLTRGTLPDGTPLPENREAFKLSKVAINAQWGPEFLAKLPKPVVFTAKREGLHPNMAADILGFGSGDELLKALIESKDPEKEIERITNERMRSRRYAGNLLKESELPSEARKAVHNEKRGRLLHMELQLLASQNLPALKGLIKKMVRRIPPLDGVREQAIKMVASKKLRALQPSLFQQAEQRAQKMAMDALLRGDVELAFEEKLRELLNHELFRAATKAQDQAASIVEYMAKFEKRSTRDRLTKAGGTFLAQIDSILARFDFRKSISGKELDRRTSLKEFFEEQTALGITVNVPDAVLNEAYATHWKQLSITELQGIHSTVRQIEHLARLKNTLLANKKTRIFDDAKQAIVSEIYANHKELEEHLDFAPGLKDKIKDFGDLAYAAHTKMEFLFEWLDGLKEQGPVWLHLFKPVVDAENEENAKKSEAAQALRKIFSVYTKKERALWFYNKEFIPEVKASFNKANLLTVALNWGNAYNRDALMRGYGWNEAQVGKLLDRLDERDVKTVQAIWDFLESYWPEAEQLERDLNGLPPAKVEAKQWDTKFGPMRGGYYPILFDARLSWRQSVLDTARMIKEMFGGAHAAQAMTRHGHLKERENTGGKPLRLEMGGLTQHVSDVIHDLTHRRAIIDLARLTEDPEVRKAIESTMGRAMYKQIGPWLQNIATDQAGDYNNPLEGILGWARKGATIVNMGWKLTTALAQPLSLTNSVNEIGAKAVLKGINAVYGKPTQFKKTWTFVTKRSEFMKHRLENYDRDVRDVMKKLNVAGANQGKMSVVATWTAPVRDSYFNLIGLMDMAVSLPSWMGAYQKAMNGDVKGLGKGDEGAAIDYADKLVRQTQGTGAAKDLAMVQRGPQSIRIFTMFYTYFSGLFNQFAKATHQASLDRNIPKYIGALALLWFVPAVLAEAVLGRGPSADDDEDEWLKWFLKTEFSYPFQTVILLRDIINGMDKYGYEPSAAFDAFETISGTLSSVPTAIVSDEELTRADAKNAVLATGYVTHMPARQIWTTLEYFYDWSEGNTEPSNPLAALYRAGVTGTPREDRP